ncbi:hypothetical protein [Zhengella mangrovi]|uniref:hypothetical protein n=1 Tax=Zhengella mangrovi TaxID=1982044 RepID=UPI001056A856|nr:hypothetical protein [Zhengella mangrovi]
MSTRLAIAALIYLVVNAVLFGIGATTVLSVPALDTHAMSILPPVAQALYQATCAPVASNVPSAAQSSMC